MIRRVQRQHKAYMNSLKIPTILQASGNVQFKEVTPGRRKQLQRKSKKEIERANSKAEGEGHHMPHNPHLLKYRILRIAQ